MKIIRNKEYNLLMSNVKAIENDKDELEYNYKKQIQHYEHLIDKIYEDLRELICLSNARGITMSDEELKELEKSEENKGFKWTNLEQVFEIINKQQYRIDKAIEYIDMIQERRKDLSVEEYHNKWCKLFDYYESQCIMLDLLDILKGSDKE